MPFVSLPDKNVLFVHIPRTGGTSVEAWMRMLGPLGLFSFSQPAVARCTPQHFRANDIAEIFGETYFDYAFTVVRNPFDRIASEYRLRAEGAKRSMWAGVPRFSTWLENVLTAFPSNRFILDNHIRPQSEFVSDRVKMFRFEDGVSTIIAQVAKDIGVPAPASVERLLQTLKDSEFCFDGADVGRIRQFYAEDFERFGYPREPSP